jgi:ABC-type bacteriocin/lantibiotic exporter with double-glycine peptidase domain
MSIVIVLFQFINTIFDLINIYLLSNIVNIDELNVKIFYFDYEIPLLTYIIYYSIFAIFKFLIQFWSNKYIFNEIQSLELGLKSKIFNVTSNLDYNNFTKIKSSEMSYSITELCKQFSNGLLLPIYKLFNEITLSTLTVIYLIAIDLNLFLFTFVYFLSFNVLFILFTKKKKGPSYGQISNQTNEKIVNLLNAVNRGYKEIYTNQKILYFTNIFNDFISTYKFAQKKYLFSSVLPKFVFELIASVYIILSVFYLNYNESENILFILSSIALISLKIIPSLASLNSLMVQINYNFNSKEKIDSYLKSNIREKTDVKIFDKINNITIKNLTYGYADNELIFEKAELVLSKGAFYVLAGESGVGKTTFIDILSGLIKVDNSNIDVDGFKVDNLKGNLYYLGQDPFIIDGNLKENILFKENSEDLLIEDDSLNKSGLVNDFGKVLIKNDDFIENGKNLSGGQKQRIGFARLLNNKSSILILDEFSSALDDLNTKKLLGTLHGIKHNHIIIAISHDKLVIDSADKIIKIENRKFKIK